MHLNDYKNDRENNSYCETSFIMHLFKTYEKKINPNFGIKNKQGQKEENKDDISENEEESNEIEIRTEDLMSQDESEEEVETK